MSSRVIARIKPELLAWARKSRGLSVEHVANSLKTTAERVEEWEAGDRELTINQLRRLAELYKRPLVVFYLPAPPKTFDAMRDFRKLPEGEASETTSALHVEIERAHQRREIAIELAEVLDTIPAPISIVASFSEDPEVVGERIREFLGIELREQFKWSDRYDALRAWREGVERKGILVFQTTLIPISEMRGFSISEEIYPTVVLNGQDTPRGKIFTLLHELTHLLLRSGGVCDFHDSGQIEPFCNHVAGAALVPPAALLSNELVAPRSASYRWSDQEIGAIADRFAVSREVVLRRLLILGKTTESFYKRKREEYNQYYLEQRLAEKEKRKEKKGGPRYFRMALRNNGIPYTRLVLSSYYEDFITANDVTDYLGVRYKHIPDIENAVFKRGEDTEG